MDNKKDCRASEAIVAKVTPLSGTMSASKDSTKTQTTTSSQNKRKPRSNSAETNLNPTKRVRKKKTDQPTAKTTIAPTPVTCIQPTTTIPTSTCIVGPEPPFTNTPVISNRLSQGINPLDVPDLNSHYFSSMISPCTGLDQFNALSLCRPSLSRLFTTSLNDANQQQGTLNEVTKAFDELRETTWTHLSRCVLDHAQQFDIPSLIGTLYTLRTENDKLVNKVRDLNTKRSQLLAYSSRLDLPGPMLPQHLSNTSPNFLTIATGLANSPKSLAMPSPGAPMPKPTFVSIGSYSPLPPASLGPTSYGFDRNSPFMRQPHSTINNIKTSFISTPSPPTNVQHCNSSRNKINIHSS